MKKKIKLKLNNGIDSHKTRLVTQKVIILSHDFAYIQNHHLNLKNVTLHKSKVGLISEGILISVTPISIPNQMTVHQLLK